MQECKKITVVCYIAALFHYICYKVSSNRLSAQCMGEKQHMGATNSCLTALYIVT